MGAGVVSGARRCRVATLEISGIDVVKGGRPVLHGVDISLADGELVAIVGPSGSGKTTLLRVVAGLDPVAAGAVRIGGVDVGATPTNQRNVAMMFQASVLYPTLDVAGNVAFPLVMQRRPQQEITRRVEAEGRVMHLEHLMDRNPKELSAGHRRLVQIARALVRSPSVFLMDEPLAALDARLRVEIRSELRVIQRGYGVTTLYVTHDPAEAMAMADRLGVMVEGRLVQLGEPAEVYARPLSRTVAEVTGDLTTLLVGVVADESGFWLDHDLFRTRVWTAALAPYTGLDVVLGLRPEHVTPAAGGFGAVVEEVVHHGRFVATNCRIGDEVVIVRSPQPFGERGDRVELAVVGGHVFDAVDGRTVASWG